mmetsp:Transcript_14991/g.26263  ORF Transcript_14991/g.26263 Transcript_14991/m.26263 type:complete len:790 (-) Transcript_14991:36-2405(-)
MELAGLVRRCQLVVRLLLVLLELSASAEVATTQEKGRWYILPQDDLSGLEAFEFALLRINEMRQRCEDFTLAPVRRQDYTVAETFIKDLGSYSSYKIHLEPAHSVPTQVHVEVSRLHSVTDLSLFEVTKVEPSPCHLYSAMDDAELMVPWKGEAAKDAETAALALLNAQRKTLCPQRPELQLLRVLTAAMQPVEGIVLRLELELRESSASFTDRSFLDQVTVIYSLDRNVPGQCTVSPEIYPARSPCSMKYEEDMQTAVDTGEGNKSDADKSRRLQLRGRILQGEAVHQESDAPITSLSKWRRLSWDATSASEAAAAAESGHGVEKPFVEKGLDLPDNFDPRLKRTLCFPRGFSRRQGSCGASWAFAATATASFRECLRKLKDGDESASLQFLAAQDLLSCAADIGCSGGSAGEAFYFMKQHGVAREACSAYRMRCFNDESAISMPAADYASSTPKSGEYSSSTEACSEDPNPAEDPCKCLPSVYHLTKTVECELLPGACPKVKIPHYFKIAGILEGNTLPQFERHMMQELLSEGPLYVSMFLYEDFFDPVSWTESGIYQHKHGALLGRHAAAAVGWGTDLNSRDYWLLLNSFGSSWQQEGYFKVLRGATSLKMMDFGAWGTEWKPASDKSRPAIFDVEVSFSPVPVSGGAASPLLAHLKNVWLRVAAATDEPARMLVRARGLSSGTTGEVRDANFTTGDIDSSPEGGEGGQRHVLQIDLLQLGLLGDRLELQLWASDSSQNSGSWGPITLEVPEETVFQQSLSGYLVPANVARRLTGAEAFNGSDVFI